MLRPSNAPGGAKAPPYNRTVTLKPLYVCGNGYVQTIFRVGFRATDTIIRGNPRRVLPAITITDSTGQFILKELTSLPRQIGSTPT